MQVKTSCRRVTCCFKVGRGENSHTEMEEIFADNFFIHKIMNIYLRKFGKRIELSEPKTEEYMEQTKRHKKRCVDRIWSEGHSIHLCTKLKTTPPKCADCQGEDLSTCIKCNAAIYKKFIDIPPPKVNPLNKKRETTGMKNETEKRFAKEDSDESEEKLALILRHLNAQRIAKKKNELRAFITDNEIGVALLSEKFRKASHTFNIPNYITYGIDRNTKPGGGTAILARKEIEHYSIPINTAKWKLLLYIYALKGAL
ncbi:hypothetical protein Trydic_g10994 [Trypoxylus dichotomus]